MKDMKKYSLLSLLLIMSIGIYAQNLFVGTYNVRNQNDDDVKDGNGWVKRCQVICDMMNFEQPDIFGTQEAKVGQIHDLQKGLDGYDYIGVAREDGKEEGEYSAIFYNKNKLQNLKNGNFWLNETPDVPKLGWDAACIRICTWGKFKDVTTNLTFYYFNLHMDHVGVVARREAAKLAVKKIKEIAGTDAPVILTGDFNVDQNDEIYNIFTNSGILKDSYVVAHQRFAENGTFNDFNPTKWTNSRIDHIFVSNHFDVNHYAILTNCYWSTAMTPRAKESDLKFDVNLNSINLVRLPSDHFPVLAKIRWNK